MCASPWRMISPKSGGEESSRGASILSLSFRSHGESANDTKVNMRFGIASTHHPLIQSPYSYVHRSVAVESKSRMHLGAMPKPQERWKLVKIPTTDGVTKTSESRTCSVLSPRPPFLLVNACLTTSYHNMQASTLSFLMGDLQSSKSVILGQVDLTMQISTVPKRHSIQSDPHNKWRIEIQYVGAPFERICTIRGEKLVAPHCNGTLKLE